MLELLSIVPLPGTADLINGVATTSAPLITEFTPWVLYATGILAAGTLAGAFLWLIPSAISRLFHRGQDME